MVGRKQLEDQSWFLQEIVTSLAGCESVTGKVYKDMTGGVSWGNLGYQ